MKIIGFDYDGTIINIEPQKAQAFGQLLQKEWNVDSSTASKFWIETGGTSRKYKFDYFYQEKFGKEINEKSYKEIENKFSTILKTKFYPNVKVLSDARSLLENVSQKFDLIFVSSGVTHEEINYLVKLNGLEKYFDKVFGTNEKYPTKADHFKEIIGGKILDLKIFVGDGLEDMKVAKKFDFIAIGVPTNHSADELRVAGADYVANLKDCTELIEKLIS